MPVQATVQPRPHQADALADLLSAFAVHDRAQLVMACGSGKTLVARWHAEASTAQRVLVLAPSLTLVAQTLAEWRRPASWPFEALVVCSDPSTSEGTAERDGEDVDRPYWAKQRAQVTTDPWVAARFLRRGRPGRPQVVFSTYHSAPVVSRAQALAAGDLEDAGVFDLAVCDEAHRLAGRPSQAFRTILDRRAIVARNRLFMTATPRTVDSDDPDVLSMDDPAVFGRPAHTVTFGEAIDAGLLVDYQVLVIADRHDDRDPATRVPTAVVDAAERFGVRRLLSFHGRVAKAEAFAEAIDHYTTPAGLFVRARAVHAGLESSERRRFLHWLGSPDIRKNQVRVLSSARCLSEGVDVPAVDGVMFADPRSSVVSVVQAVGRVLRPAPGKTIGTVIVPVALDEDGDDDTSLTVSDWGPVWTVLRALKAHDVRLAQEIDKATREHATTGRAPGGWRPGRVHFVLPDDIDTTGVHLRLVQEVGTAWEHYFAILQDWVDTHPGVRIPSSLKHKGSNIGWWVERQRLAHRRGVLPVGRVASLESLPTWVWDRKDGEWVDTAALVERIAGAQLDESGPVSPWAEHKTLTKPVQYLGTWVAEQRQAWRDGTLRPDRVERLERIPGWSWTVLPDHDSAHVDALRVFVEFEKHANVPTDCIEDGLRLGRWCWDVRRRYLTGTIHPALVDEITAATPSKWAGGSAHWSWEQIETQWRLMYTALRQYAQREGHAAPPGTVKEKLPDGEVRLGQWVALQRHRHKKGELDDDHAAALERLPGWLWAGLGNAKPVGEPIDLGGHRHGTAKGGVAGCQCQPCKDYRTRVGREWLDRRRALKDPVPAGPAARQVAALEKALIAALTTNGDDSQLRNGRTAIAAASDVPLAVIRNILSGKAVQLERAHAERLLALTTADVVGIVATRKGSRGRPVSTVNERIDGTRTRELMARLAEQGFGPGWVGRELGYQGRAFKVGDGMVTRRTAQLIEDLVARVGTLRWHGPVNHPSPTLAELLGQQEAAS